VLEALRFAGGQEVGEADGDDGAVIGLALAEFLQELEEAVQARHRPPARCPASV